MTVVNILLIVEKRIGARRCNVINHPLKANKKYIKDHEASKDFSYWMYWVGYNMNIAQHCHKTCLWMVLNAQKANLDSINNLLKIAKNIVTKDTSSKSVLSTDLTILLERKKIKKIEKFVCNLCNQTSRSYP